MFLAVELALLSCALMARQNLRTSGAPGTPGLLVWFITAVQVIPAYAESGIVGGTVRAVVGPIMAAVLWHLAMGTELRHSPGPTRPACPRCWPGSCASVSCPASVSPYATAPPNRSPATGGP